VNLIRLRSSRFLVPGLALAAGMATAAPAPGADCIRIYAGCLVRVSDLGTWWERSAAGIDCYLDAVACVMRAYG
jgi:hypothetical protein